MTLSLNLHFCIFWSNTNSPCASVFLFVFFSRSLKREITVCVVATQGMWHDVLCSVEMLVSDHSLFIVVVNVGLSVLFVGSFVTLPEQRDASYGQIE